jgi:hypothetical protein
MGEALRISLAKELVKVDRFAEAERIIEAVKLRSDDIDWIRGSVKTEINRRNSRPAERPVF